MLEKPAWSVEDVEIDVEIFKINEAFVVVAMAAARDLNIPADRLNVNGDAGAHGHPIGATGPGSL